MAESEGGTTITLALHTPGRLHRYLDRVASLVSEPEDLPEPQVQVAGSSKDDCLCSIVTWTSSITSMSAFTNPCPYRTTSIGHRFSRAVLTFSEFHSKFIYHLDFPSCNSRSIIGSHCPTRQQVLCLTSGVSP